ncbi:type VI secretion protein ImpB [Bifidobacterium aerophilum]|uniref:Type VI secretion protein ImpB n=2 Tax=Bifidobacterium aerophilum TaxID=1798155 RepID=A0A6N9Z366_9BIFI|nr:type VI secretion protein ImpB [Bifidobacterium aerophilum]
MFDNGGMDERTDRTYLAIDLKSFYASAECASRGLDPLTTNLVVADVSRTEKTICLAVSPALKAYGIGGRARLFEVVETMKRVNEERRMRAPGRRLTGEAFDSGELAANPSLKAGYYAAKPRMAYYLKVSGDIYGIYLRYASPDDIHVYSIDEVFIDVTHYLGMYGVNAHDLARRIVRDIVAETGITATAGIGPNMYLAKVAMDIVAKHMPADRDGVRVAELDEAGYRRMLWGHRPLTDFWRVGRGYARRLEEVGLHTMGDIARCSLGRASDYYNEDLLYRMFGVNAETLIDHAWGWEPCTIADIKAYRPAENSLSSGQVLHRPYAFASARLVTREMADTISLELVDKGMATNQIGLYVGYEGREGFEGSMPVSTNRYGKKVPRPANGMLDLGEYTSSTTVISDAMMRLYDRIVDRTLMVRRINVVVGRLRPYADVVARGDAEDADAAATTTSAGQGEQLELFDDPEQEEIRERQAVDRSREHDVQQALLAVKHRFGRNAVIKAMNLEPDATGRDRNNQIGGHAA